MIRVRLTAYLLYRFTLVCLGLFFVTSSLSAQGLASVAVPRTGQNAAAVYRAKVRESVTTVLEKWARSLEHRDSVATAAAYTANARSVIGDQPEAETAAAVVKQLYKTGLAGSYLDISVKDFDMGGDLAFVSSVLIAPSGPGDSAPLYIHSLFVFKYDDWHDRWQVREQFIDWRGVSPPPEPAQ